jgi:hypothetical protein
MCDARLVRVRVFFLIVIDYVDARTLDDLYMSCACRDCVCTDAIVLNNVVFSRVLSIVYELVLHTSNGS